MIRFLFLAFFFLSTSIHADELKDGIKNSIVRLTVTFQKVNHYYPWLWRSPSSRSGQGIVIGKNLVLTQATLLNEAKLIELRLNAEPAPIIMKVIYKDLDRNVALLSGELPIEAKVLTIPEKSIFKTSEKIQYFWKTDTGRFLEGTASFNRAEAFRLKSSFQAQLWFTCSHPTTRGGYGEPVFYNKKFVGIAIGGSDASLNILRNETIHSSLNIYKDASLKTAMLGFDAIACTQKYLREENNLKQNDGGCYIKNLYEQGSGSKNLRKGDILLSVNGHALDAWGRYKHSQFESIFFTHLLSDIKLKDKVNLNIMRLGKPQTIVLDTDIIDDKKWLIPRYRNGEQSRYFIRGGFIFQNLSFPYLQAWGSNWEKKAPETILSILAKNRHKIKSEERQDIVLLSHVLSHPLNRSLQRLGRQVIKSVNGKDVVGLKSLFEIFEKNEDSLTLELSPGSIPVILSPKHLSEIDADIQKRYNIPVMNHL